MDLLLYNRKDSFWADDDKYAAEQVHIEADTKLTAEQITKKKDMLALKRAARFEVDDISEEVADGRYANQSNEKFRVVHAEGEKMRGNLSQSLMDGNVVLKNRRYKVDTAGLVFVDGKCTVKFGDLKIIDKAALRG